MKEALKAEFDKLKPMTAKEKAEYIWEYYRLHIIIFAVIALFTYSVLDAAVFNPPKDVFLGLAVYGPFVEQETADAIQLDLQNALLPEELEGSAKVYVTDFFLDNMPSDFVTANTEKFFAMCTARELDIIIAPAEHFTLLAENEYLFDLSDLNGIDYNVSDMFFCARQDGGADSARPVGIALENAPFLNRPYLNETDFFLGVIINTPRIDAAVSAVNYILNFKEA